MTAPPEAYEALLSRHPVVVHKRVRWADCDPAGVVYTGKFSEYLLVAVGYFFDVLGQGHYARWLQTLEVDTPCKGLDLAFHGALWPEDVFQMRCHVGALREHSYDLHVEATQADGRRVFSGRFSPICIRRGVRERAPMPAAMRQALLAHQLPLFPDPNAMTRPIRIGQIVPSSNTTMETEIPAMLRAREAIHPERFTFHGSRMRMHKVTPEELAAMNQQGLRCAAELADARVDVMSTACLVAIMAQGVGYHRQVETDFARIVAENGATSRVMTSAGALIHGLHQMGAKKIALMAPYMRPLTDKVVAYIEAEGIEVLDSLCFEIPDNLEVGRRDPLQLLDDVKRLNTANADVVVLSACVQMPSLPALQIAQDRLGIPVTSTAACTVRQMLDLLELPAGIPGFGAVLA